VYEAAVVLVGAVVGLSAYGRVRAWPAVAAASVIVGVAASAVSGELAVSWVFVLIDSAQACAGAVVGSLLVAVVRRWWPASV